MLALLLLAQNPVTVRLNHDQFDPGDRARVYVQTAQDGYLVVLHADPEGRIRVLFPLDPTDDDFVRGGKKFEVRGRGDRDAFQVEPNDGSGTVIAAVSPDAFKFGDFVRNDHWDFRALGSPSGAVRDDPLARMLDIVQKISGDSAGRYDYDYATYVVNSRGIAARYGYGGGYYPRFGLGYYYNPFFDPFCADPFYGWSASCYAAAATGLASATAIPFIGRTARIVPTSSPRSRDRGSPSHAWSFRADRAITYRPRSARATRADPTSLRGSLVAAHPAPSRASRAAAGRACRAASGGAGGAGGAGARARRHVRPVAAAAAGAAAGIN